MSSDYDAPRRRADGADGAEDSLEELQARRDAARSATADVDVTEADTFELPGADLADDANDLSVPVVPMQTGEFRCCRCFLVVHHTRLARHGDDGDVCQDCAA